MAEGGACLLAFVASTPIFPAYKNMSVTEKWAPHMEDVDKYIASLHFCHNPGEKLNQSMSKAGFKSYKVEVKERSFVYKGRQIMRGKLLNGHFSFKFKWIVSLLMAVLCVNCFSSFFGYEVEDH